MEQRSNGSGGEGGEGGEGNGEEAAAAHKPNINFPNCCVYHI